MAKTSGNSKKPMTKSEITETLATETDLTKKRSLGFSRSLRS